MRVLGVTFSVIISRAPLRISLFGGGSDLPSYSNLQPGAVLSFSINKYVYIVLHPNFLGQIQLKYSKSELVNEPSQIAHPIFRETLLMLNMNQPLEIGSFADVPATGTGLGASSSFTVALIKAVSTFQGVLLSKEEIARIACEIEIDKCNDPIGMQDQWASSMGGINRFVFDRHLVNVNQINLEKGQLASFQNTMMLFYVGGERNAHKILASQAEAIRTNLVAFKALSKMVEIVDIAEVALRNSEYSILGELLNESWHIKKSLTPAISNARIDEIYRIAIQNGASGGKLLGAGGAGFMIFIVKEGMQGNLLDALKFLRHIPFQIEHKGAEIIFSESDSK